MHTNRCLPAVFVIGVERITWITLYTCIGLGIAIVPSADAQNCSSCQLQWPACHTCNIEYQNENSGGSVPFLSTSISDLTIHANRFSGMPVNQLITHVCVSLKSPTGQPNEPASIKFYSSSPGQLPGAAFHTEPFVVNPQGASNTQLVPINGGAGIVMPGPAWVAVEYPTATAMIGHQRAATRLGTVSAGDCALFINGFGWQTYDQTGLGSPFYGRAPIIRALELTDCGNMVVVTPTSGLTTTESGGLASFNVQLSGNCPPLNDVEIQLSTSDPSEGTVAPQMIVIPFQQWTQPQVVTITGVDDVPPDGDIQYSINTSTTFSFDQCWDNLAVADVSVTNLDNEPPPGIAFSGPTLYATPPAPWAVAAADFDADGDDDLAVTILSVGGVALFENTGPGANFSLATTVLGVADPRDLVATDINSDGRPDFVVPDSSGGTVTVFANMGSFSFANFATINAGNDVRKIEVADIDGDCDSDIIAVNTNPPGNRVVVLRNLGGGSFSAPQPYAVGTNPIDLALADADSDGDLDIYVANSTSRDVSFLRNDGSGAFTAFGPYVSGFGTQFLNGIGIGDWDNDGDPDVVVGNANLTQVAVLYNNGAGGLTSPTIYSVGDRPSVFEINDYDGDGFVDIAVTCSNFPYQLSVLPNLGGTFGSAQTFSTNSNPVGLASADFDRNGTIDLAVGVNGFDELAVFLNSTYHDCNGNGVDDTTETVTNRTFMIIGTSTALEWSLSVSGVGLFGEQLATPCIPFGGNADAFALRFVESISNIGCPAIRAARVAGASDQFVITVPGPNLTFCVGPAGASANCCFPPSSSCGFNPDVLLLSGADCNANGQDDALDIYFGTSPDVNANGSPDECEGDLNLDGFVGFDDFLIASDCWLGPNNGLGPGCAPADLDDDADYDLHDFASLVLSVGAFAPPAHP